MTTKDDGGPVDGRNYTYVTDYEGIDHPDQEITTLTAERCLAFLRDTSEAQAAWTARRKFLDKYIGVVLAMEEKKQQAGSATDRSRNAKTSRPYMKIIRDLEEAIYHETLLGSLRNAADKKFSGWQTLNANLRTGVKHGTYK